MRSWLLRSASAVLGAAVLAGCAGLKPAIEEGGAMEETLGGRFSVRYVEAASQAEKGLQGNFRWQEGPQATVIELSSPLGTILARIRVDAQGAELTTSSGDVRRAADVDALAAEGLGWRLPVSGLRHWLRGRLAPAAGRAPGRIEHGPDGRAALIEQDGWRVQFQDYAMLPGNAVRPARMVVDYLGEGGQVSLRLALRYE